MKLSKNMTNLQIAELLRAVAASYQLKDADANKFRIVAYERAADAVEHATSELKDLWDDGKLEEVPGVGPSIAAHLDELFKTGTSKHFKEVMEGIPPEAFRLTELPGIGIKTAMKMITEGDRKEIDLKLKEVSEKEKKGKRHLLPYAVMAAGLIIDWMKKNKNVSQIDPLGSLRRQAGTIGDIDLSVATDSPAEVLEHFIKYPDSQKTIEKGDTTASIMVPGGVRVDLMIQPPESYGSLLQHFTGSKHHNIALREYALKKGFSLSEYGIKNIKTKKIAKFRTEEEFYKHLGLSFIPPELREDTGEIEAAKEKNLPNLVSPKDIKGDLQIHSSFDVETSHDTGISSMEEVIEEGNKLDYEYLAFTEHNPSRSKHTDTQIVEILKRKREKVDQLNYSLKKEETYGIHKVFNSLEIDILPDGSLPVPDAGMDTLDFALVSIHSSFELNREQMTRRVLLALSHPKVKIFAHPTARKLNEREGVELNWPEIFDFCLKHNKWIEINADPMRLDLPDTLVHEAVKAGVKLTLGTDAHSASGLLNMPYGVSVARRGWAKASDIINTRNLTEFEKLLERR
ncbi:MAG TPA: hypothetical protein VJ227_04250 [Patescibacteria group bacterium]|nr:hypothetical protein [Patescibacteria group bacterium]